MLLSKEQAERYARHFALREIGLSGQKRLLESKVLVIGAGALGSSALMYLASAGVGTIGIADYDRVDLSNLQRQIIHRTNTVSVKKTVSAKQTLFEINPDVSVKLYDERITPDNIRDVIETYDFVIDVTDLFESKFLINDACVLSGKPYSHAGAVRFEGQTMTYVPGKGPCLRCLLDKIPPHEDAFTCSQAGVLGTVTGVLGSIQATEAIKYLLDAGDLLTGRLLHFDGLAMRIRTVNAALPNLECRVCGKDPSIRSLADNRAEYDEITCSLPSAEKGAAI
ncbi:MAG: HesA/MoeB/ThiF family protein [Oscillospiraceae bacterium]|nr:HesA/MoeB/ThiF family protein [Oscillospiraceae bacterium]